MNILDLFENFRGVRSPISFLLRHEKGLRRLQREEQGRGEFTPWLSHAIEAIDVHGDSVRGEHQ